MLPTVLLVGAAVAPRLSARVTGDTFLVRVELVDPIDPYRGAYVALSYPDLREPAEVSRREGLDGGRIFLPLRREGRVWVADRRTTERPDSGPYVTCVGGYDPRCGIESWFLPQDEAAAMERRLADGAYAELRVDSRGNAALVGIRG